MNRTVHPVVLAVALAISMSACSASISGTLATKAVGTDTTTAATAAGGPSAGPGGSSSAMAGSVSATDTSATSLSAASSSGTASGAACALATLSEITAAAGKPMAVSGGADTVCVFSAVSDPGLFIYAQVYPDVASMVSMKQLESTGSEKLAGIGDDAFWNPIAGAVFVQKGSRAFSFELPSMANLTGNPDAAKSRMVTLAKATAAHF